MNRSISTNTFKNIHVIVNPVSGSEPPPLETIEAQLKKAGAIGQIHLTEPDLGGRALARTAVAQKADLVIACGGDGTVTEVAEGLLGSGVPLAVVPLGTANVFAAELDLPHDVSEALALVTEEEHTLRPVDMGCVEGEYFLLRLGIGWEAAMTVLAPESFKEQYGRWAYLWTALRIRRRLHLVRYHLVIDGQEQIVEGVSCLVCNSGNIGLPGMKIMPEIDVADGRLDVLVVRRSDWRTLLSLAFQVLRSLLPGFTFGPRTDQFLSHWSGREIEVSAEPPQLVARDGEPVDQKFPLKTYVVPKAVRVLIRPKMFPE